MNAPAPFLSKIRPVEDGWIDYNTQYRARFAGALPADLVERDDRLYLGVQDVEREFERSGCPRP